MILLCNDLDQTGAVLDALPSPNPVAAQRLVRLHGRPDVPDWSALRASSRWQSAVELVQACEPA